MSVFSDYDLRFDEARRAVDESSIKRLIYKLEVARKLKHPIIIIGNGGSMATASHFALDLNKSSIQNCNDYADIRYRTICLSDISAMSAWSNDSGYEDALAQQIVPHIQDGGLEIVISASGNSPNILKAVSIAKKLGVPTFGLTGFDGGKLKNLADDCIHVPSRLGDYRVVEDVHMQVAHKIVEAVSDPLTLADIIAEMKQK